MTAELLTAVCLICQRQPNFPTSHRINPARNAPKTATKAPNSHENPKQVSK